jgi:hypothetical protein
MPLQPPVEVSGRAPKLETVSSAITMDVIDREQFRVMDMAPRAGASTTVSSDGLHP